MSETEKLKIENKEDRNTIAEIMYNIFGDDADSMTPQIVLPGDILRPLLIIYKAGYDRANLDNIKILK
jgi:hypothetical protein